MRPKQTPGAPNPLASSESDVRSDDSALTRLATPIALTQLAQVAVATTNIGLMGSLGVPELAAGGLAVVLFNQIRTMAVGLITATGNQIATAAGKATKSGASADDEIRDIVRGGFLVATGAALVGALVLIGLAWALPWLGQDAAVLELARPMMIALAPGLLPCLWFAALRQYTVGMQRPQAMLAVTLGAIVVNLGLGVVLMRWFGLTGIGIATSVVFGLMFVVFWAIVRRDPKLARTLPTRMWPVQWATVGSELRLGAPIALTYGAEAGMFSVLALVVGTAGPDALAAHHVVYQLVYIVFQVAIGLSHGASILVSSAVARDEHTRARRLAWVAMRQAALVCAVAGVVYVVAPTLVLRPFLDGADSATVDIARTLLLVAALLQFADAAQNVAVGLLRGLKDTKAGLRLSLVGYWVVGVPVAALLALPFGVVGVWFGLLTGLAVTAALMLRRYLSLLAQHENQTDTRELSAA